jgi:sigma-E factor negative regulatory protein RseB
MPSSCVAPACSDFDGCSPSGFLKNQYCLLLVLVLLCWWMPVSANTMPSASSLLAEMATAAHRLDYAGRFVYSHDNHLSSLSILHVSKSGREEARLIHLDGHLAEVIHKDGVVFYVRQGHHVTRLAGHGGMTLFSLPKRLAGKMPDEYEARVDGSDRVAGRAAWRLDLLPRDDWRYGYRLWLDQASHLLLKSQVVGEDNRVLEQVQFTSLTLNPSYDARSFHVPGGIGGAVKSPTPVPPGSMESVGWRLDTAWLPAGFQRVESDARMHADSPQVPVEAVTYSDGLAVFTLFVQPLEKETRVTNGRMGSTLALSRQVSCAGRVCRVTLVGELPIETANRILSAVSLSQ